MKEDKKKRLFSPSQLLFYGVALLVFYLVIRYMGKLADIKTLLAQMNPLWIIVILCLQVATYTFYALILRALLSVPDNRNRVRFFTLFKMAIVQLFVNQTLPTGGISGNGYLLNQLVKRKVGGILAFKALVMESISYYIAFIFGLISAYILFRYSSYHIVINSPAIPYTTVTGIVFFLALGCIMLLLNNKRMQAFVVKKLSRFSFFGKYINKINLPVPEEENKTIAAQVFISADTVFKAVLFQLCLISCDILTVYCLLFAFHIHLSPVLVLLGVFLSMVAGSLPVSPGSLIVYESAMTYFFTLLGVPLHAAMIVTLLYRFFTFWLPIPVGLLLYRRLQKESVT